MFFHCRISNQWPQPSAVIFFLLFLVLQSYEVWNQTKPNSKQTKSIDFDSDYANELINMKAPQEEGDEGILYLGMYSTVSLQNTLSPRFTCSITK